jgi:hypothetical protein
MINFALHMMKDYHVLIFSSHLRQAFADRFPPLLHNGQDQLLAQVERLAGDRRPEVTIFPHGGVSFPIIAPQQGGPS